MPFDFKVGDLVVPKPGEDMAHIEHLCSIYAQKTYVQGTPLEVIDVRDDYTGIVLTVKYGGRILPNKWASRFVKVGPDYVPPSKEELLIKKIQQLYNRQKYVVEGASR